MNKPLQITGKLLTRNWLLNLVGELLPLALGLIAVPYVVRGLGPERFGILSIAWVLLSYTTVLDLGLSRATTKFAAEYLGRGEPEKLSGIVWTSVRAQAVLGIVGAVLAASITPLLVNHVLKIPVALRGESRAAFLILAVSLPVVMIGNVFRGLLEAGQSFGLVNYVRMPTNASIFFLPAVALPLGIGLAGIVLLLVFARLIATTLYVVFCFKRFPVLRSPCASSPTAIRELLAYGGWMTISNTVSPLMTYLDRFFVGSLVSMAAVGYYTAPYEVVRRASIFPAGLTATIFPAFSSLDASGSQRRLEELCVRSLKSLLLVLAPCLILVVFFARRLLNLWLGAEFATQSTLVLQLLAAGMLINAMAFIPMALIQGLGRPDLTAKFHLFELPLYIGILIPLVKHMGINGAALAWTLRALLDAALLFGSMLRLNLVSTRNLVGNGLAKSAAAVLVLAGSLSIPLITGESAWRQAITAVITVFLFGWFAWKRLLDNRDRHLVAAATGQLRGTFAKAS